jgi:branched-subunit amino acid aminotransferase/4-amino-4-deoxychorismate lyase
MNRERMNRTLLYGEGLFETLRVYRGRQVPLLEAHCRRMAHGAEFFRFPFSPSVFKKAVEEGLRGIAKEAEARLRVTLEVWGEEGPAETRLVTHSTYLGGTDEDQRTGVRLIRAPFARSLGSPLLAFKTTNYFENSYARQWARLQGYDDALFLNERGEVTETTTANLFFILGRKLITPPVSAGLLPGIARGVVLSCARECGLVPEERPVTADDLRGADEILLSNAVIEVVPVKEIARTFTARSAFDRTGALRAAYREQVFARGVDRTA